LDDLDLSPLLVQADPGKNNRYCQPNLINEVPPTLDSKIYKDIKNLFEQKNKIELSYEIKNVHRAVGTRLSHYIYKKFNKEKIEKNSIIINLSGSAGQSLGAFGIKGLKLNVTGDANDYVGKGLSGATIVVKPPSESKLTSNENTIIGNTVLYGATSGKLFASGQSGERFAVRNSGAEAVIEGCDSNGCEYMTGGTVVILGKVGDNFAAGMTGGMAFIFDSDQEFENYVNPNSVVWQTPETSYWKNYLKNLIEEHFKETKSNIAKEILENFDSELKKFKQVCPKEMLDKLINPLTLKGKISKAI
jgi:glutamate synthase (NADPH/NADH) large chain